MNLLESTEWKTILLTYKWWIIGGFSSLILAAVSIWFVPSFHAQAEAMYRTVLGEPSASPLAEDSPLPTEEPLKQLAEQVAILETRVQQQGIDLSQTQQSELEVQARLKDTTTEIAKTNDILEKRQTELLTTLKRLGITPAATPASNNSKTNPTSGSSGQASTVTETGSGKININTASAAELDELPGVGPAYAQRIVAYREEKGQFKKVEDLLEITGIGQSILEKIKDLVEV